MEAQEENKKNKQGMTFISIPGEVAFNPELSSNDKFIWWVIRTLDVTEDHCFSSNEFIAHKTFLKERTVCSSIAKLIKLGYVKKAGFDGRKRELIINSNLSQFHHFIIEYNNMPLKRKKKKNRKNSETDTQNVRTSINNTSNIVFNNKIIKNKYGSGGTTTAPLKLIKRKNKDIAPEKSTADRIKEKSNTLQTKKTPTQEVKLNNKILPFIEMWEEAGGTKHRRDSKVFASAVGNLKRLVSRGTFFNDKGDEFKEFADTKLEIGDWGLALRNYTKARKPEYLPRKKDWIKRLSLANFIYQPYASIKSPLIYFIKFNPQFIVQDNNPILTKSLTEQFAEWNPNYKPNGSDRNKFISASNKATTFFEEHKNKIASHFHLTPHKIAQFILRAVKKDMEGSSMLITPGFLCSDKTFDHRLPTYLKNQAVFSTIDRGRFR